MSGAALFVMAYGVAVVAGGVLGYVRADSLISLVVGALTGLALFGLGCAMSRGKKVAAIALVPTLLVLFYSANRVFSGMGPGPNPPLTMAALLLLSIVAAVVLLARILHRSGKR
jgi:uncharacterized membrane protein (UPF0136 family)